MTMKILCLEAAGVGWGPPLQQMSLLTKLWRSFQQQVDRLEDHRGTPVQTHQFGSVLTTKPSPKRNHPNSTSKERDILLSEPLVDDSTGSNWNLQIHAPLYRKHALFWRAGGVRA